MAPYRFGKPLDTMSTAQLIYETYTNNIKTYIMGIVKISEDMHAALRDSSAALSRSINSQAEHWLRVGMLAELNPGLDYRGICQLLIQSGGTIRPIRAEDDDDKEQAA
jgi:hypothetical protein